MAVLEVTLDTIAKMDDGKLAAAFALLAREAIQDCADRPALTKKRKVTMTVEFEPELEGRNLSTVKFAVDFQGARPALQSRVYSGRLDRKGRLTFNDLSPDDPDQMTLDQLGTQREEAR